MRVGRLLVTGPLDLLSIHAHAELRPSPKKKFMIVRSGIGPLRNTSKTIKIELALKRRQF